MNQQTELGAQQAYEYFWQMYAYARKSGDGESLRPLVAASCHWCQREISSASAGKERWVSGELTAERSTSKRRRKAQVDVYLDFSIIGQMATSSPSKRETFTAGSIMVWQGDRWVVTSVDIRKRSK